MYCCKAKANSAIAPGVTSLPETPSQTRLSLPVACAATNAPIGYWTGTPTGGIPFRCDMNSNGLWRTDDGKAPGVIDQRLYYPFAASTFSLPGIRSLGFGNTPPALTYGPGMVNFDVSLNKSFRVHERKTLELRPASEVAKLFARVGADKSKRMLVYCGGGIAATLDAFLLHQLGYTDIAVYDASMSEWARDPSLPIEVD